KPDPDPRIHVALAEHGHVELERIVGGIARRLARVEGAARSATNESTACILPHQILPHDPRADGSVLQRCGLVVEFGKLRQALVELGYQVEEMRSTGGI